MKMRMIKECISQTLNAADFTDATATTGTLAFTEKLPIGAMVLGWKAVVTGAFTGDSSCEISVGISTDADKYSADTTENAFAAGTFGSLALAADSVTGLGAELTPFVTITSATNMTLVIADATGEMVITLYYIDTK